MRRVEEGFVPGCLHQRKVAKAMAQHRGGVQQLAAGSESCSDREVDGGVSADEISSKEGAAAGAS